MCYSCEHSVRAWAPGAWLRVQVVTGSCCARAVRRVYVWHVYDDSMHNNSRTRINLHHPPTITQQQQQQAVAVRCFTHFLSAIFQEGTYSSRQQQQAAAVSYITPTALSPAAVGCYLLRLYIYLPRYRAVCAYDMIFICVWNIDIYPATAQDKCVCWMPNEVPTLVGVFFPPIEPTKWGYDIWQAQQYSYYCCTYFSLFFFWRVIGHSLIASRDVYTLFDLSSDIYPGWDSSSDDTRARVVKMGGGDNNTKLLRPV